MPKKRTTKKKKAHPRRSKKTAAEAPAAPHTSESSQIPEFPVEQLPIDQVKPAPYNPRQDLRPGDPRYENLKQSIKTHGMDPLRWNKRTGYLIAGHQRLKIARELGMAAVPCYVHDLSETAEREFNLAHNKMGGTWDEIALVELLVELQHTEDASLDRTGFCDDEVRDLLAQEQLDDTTPPEKAVPEAYGLIIDCRDADHQQATYKDLKAQGHKVKVVTL